MAESIAWLGHRIDPTGFYYFGFRYYEPTVGRWLSPDPLGHAVSMSLYDYAGNNPINGVDPSGLSVRWNSTLSPNEKSQILSQIIFLSKSPEVKNSWNNIVNSETKFVVGRDRSPTSLGRVEATNPVYINFDLDVGQKTSTGDKIYPVQVSSHEIGHANDIARLGLSLFNTELIDQGLNPRVAPFVPNKAELSALEFERQVSRELGLFDKMNYAYDPDYILDFMTVLPPAVMDNEPPAPLNKTCPK
jgi:RHS repeat-associated protein